MTTETEDLERQLASKDREIRELQCERDEIQEDLNDANNELFEMQGWDVKGQQSVSDRIHRITVLGLDADKTVLEHLYELQEEMA